MRSTFAMVFGCMGMLPAHGAVLSITQNQAYSLQTAASPGGSAVYESGLFALFDPSLGELVEVSLHYEGSLRMFATGGWHDSKSGAGDAFIRLFTTMEVELDGADSARFSLEEGSLAVEVSALGTKEGGLLAESSWRVDKTIQLRASDFEGVGQFSETLVLASDSTVAASGLFRFDGGAEFTGRSTLVYSYRPIPEVADSLAFLVSGVIASLVIRRRGSPQRSAAQPGFKRSIHQ